MKTMSHKGYTAHIHYSDEDSCFVGHVVHIDDIVGFHGDTDAELRDAFENVVELYIEVLEKQKAPPQTPEARGLLSQLRQAFQQKFLHQLPWRLK